MKSKTRSIAATIVLAAATVIGTATPSPAQVVAVPMCFGQPATIVGAGNIGGTPGNDVIVGSNGADNIRGGGGNDRICSLGGDDRNNGGAGYDRIDGGTHVEGDVCVRGPVYVNCNP